MTPQSPELNAASRLAETLDEARDQLSLFTAARDQTTRRHHKALIGNLLAIAGDLGQLLE